MTTADRDIEDTKKFANAFHRASCVTREMIFDTARPQMPEALQDDAQIPWVGLAGRKYTSGGDLLLAINPGGGSPAYTSRSAMDELIYPALSALLRSQQNDRISSFEALVDVSSPIIRTWNIWTVIGAVLEATRQELSEVAFLNWCPFRTKDNAMPYAIATKRSEHLVVRPVLNALRPKRIIALGKKAGHLASKYELDQQYELIVLPRTNGDRYLSPETRTKLHQLAADRKRHT